MRYFNGVVGEQYSVQYTAVTRHYLKCAYVRDGFSYNLYIPYETYANANNRVGIITDDTGIILAKEILIWGSYTHYFAFVSPATGWLSVCVDNLSGDPIIMHNV